MVYFYFGGDDQGWSSFTSALTDRDRVIPEAARLSHEYPHTGRSEFWLEPASNESKCDDATHAQAESQRQVLVERLD